MNVNELNLRFAKALELIRANKPLVHQITNHVVMNDTANITLHIGALPVMAHAVEEAAEMTGLAGALVLNIGTLSPAWVDAMLLAGRRANELGIPVVLDPVGAGATTYRTETSLRLLEELRVAVVRGNSGEVGALSGAGGVVRGVESVEGVADPAAAAGALARRYGTTVVITGRRDIVTDGERVLAVDNGHEWLTTITGSGCMSTSLVGAFAAVEPDFPVAAAGALAAYGLAAEKAAREARGPASFRAALLDEVYRLTPEEVAAGARVERLR